MLVIRAEVWPGGDKRRAEQVSCVVVVNDRTGSSTRGNYDIYDFGADGDPEDIFLGPKDDAERTAKLNNYNRTLGPVPLIEGVYALIVNERIAEKMASANVKGVR